MSDEKLRPGGATEDDAAGAETPPFATGRAVEDEEEVRQTGEAAAADEPAEGEADGEEEEDAAESPA